jgi:hypothetical protein
VKAFELGIPAAGLTHTVIVFVIIVVVLIARRSPGCCEGRSPHRLQTGPKMLFRWF